MAHSGFRRDPAAANSEAIEDYAKALLALEERGQRPVSTSALAERVGVSPGSVTAMLKRMAEQGLVDYQPYRGAQLTARGARVALEVTRHHRLLEAYLSEVLGMPWDRVHDEAEVLEHYISEELEELIASALGHPERDPHGDPIPDRDLAVVARRGTPLSELEPGRVGTFERVSDSDPEMLRYLDARGIRPGAELVVGEREPFGGGISIEVDGREHTIGAELAKRMLIARR